MRQLYPAITNHFTFQLFQNETEYQYFLHFRDDVSHKLSGPFSKGLWDGAILRATNDEASLRNLVISIASLSKFKANEKSPNAAADPHYQFALMQYGKAVRKLRELTSTRRDSGIFRIALIASILIYCFENMHGEHDVAIMHIESALNLIRTRLPSAGICYSQSLGTHAIPGLEVEVLDAFVRLDNCLTSRMESSKVSRINLLDINYLDKEFIIPRAFRSILEARNFLEHIQYRSLSLLSHLPRALMQGTLISSSIPNYGEIGILSSQIHQWYSAFSLLFARACTCSGKRDFNAAATLRALALASELSLKRVGLTAEDACSDMFVLESREIVLLCSSILSVPEHTTEFVFDCGFIPALFIVITICRQRELREDAIRLLRKAGPRKEFTWGAEAAADFGEKILAAEDEMS